MRPLLSTLGKQTLIYGISGTALQAVGLITLPVFARTFTPAEYGVLEIVTVGLAALLLVADLGLASALQRSYFDYSDDEQARRRRVVATAILAALVMALGISAAIALARVPLADWLFDGQGYTTLIALAALSIPLTVAATMLRQVMRLHFRPWHFATSATLSAILAGGLGAGLVLWTSAGLNGVVIGLIAGNLLGVLYGLVVVGRDSVARFSVQEWRDARLRASADPRGRGHVGHRLPRSRHAQPLGGPRGRGDLRDRFAFRDRRDARRHGIGGLLTVSALAVVRGSGGRAAPRVRVLTYVAIVLAFMSLELILFAREVLSVIAPDFGDVYDVVGILCLSVTIFGVASVAAAAFVLARKTHLIATDSLIAVAVNFVFALVLIPPLDGLGVALATLGGYATLAVAYYLNGQRVYPTAYVARKLVVAIGAAAAMMPVGLLSTVLEHSIVKILTLASFPAVLVLLRVIHLGELTAILERRAAVICAPVPSPPPPAGESAPESSRAF